MIGCGHVGFNTMKAFHIKGHEVFGYDPAEDVQQNIRSTFGAQASATDFGNLAICDLVFACVPTDPIAGSGDCDLSLFSGVVGRMVALESYEDYRCKVFVQRSTCPPGTARRHAILFKKTSYSVNPSFLRKKTQWEDSINPERIAIAGDTTAKRWLSEVYKDFEAPIYISDCFESVEILKYIENVIDAVLVSLWNEFLTVADALSISRGEFTRLMDILVERSKFGTAIRVPGQAFGLWCLPKDLAAFANAFEDCAIQVIKAALATNQHIFNKYGENGYAGTELFTVNNGKIELTSVGREYILNVRNREPEHHLSLTAGGN